MRASIASRGLDDDAVFNTYLGGLVPQITRNLLAKALPKVKRKVFCFANTDWYLFNFRLSLLRKLREDGVDVTALTPKGPFQKKFSENSIKHVAVPMKRTGRLGIQDLRTVVSVFLLYARNRPDVVHHFTLHSALFGMFCAKLARVPHRINAITGLGYLFTQPNVRDDFRFWCLRFLLRMLLGGKKTHIVVQNQSDYDFFLINQIGRFENVHLIYGSGVDTSHFIPNTTRQNSTCVRVLMASRILVDKGVREYIEAIQSKRLQGKKIHFLLAGQPDSGNPSSIDPVEIASWDRITGFEYLGHVDDMAELLNSVDVFVLPSYREGLPRSLLEAAACALPIVTTDVPGCNEVVIDEFNGLLVSARQSETLALAIERMVDSPSLRWEFGQRGRQRVSEHFGEDLVLTKTLDIYRKLFAN